MPRALYLIDGYAQIFRCYYAPFGNLTAPSGEPTRATHVFCQMLLSLMRDKQPDYLVMALDTADETVFRREISPDYKAHRQPPPEDLPVQADRIIALMQALRLPMLRAPGFEADDIIATLVRRLDDPDLNIYLVSKDKDLEQLLSDRVFMYDPHKDEVITPERLREIKGWSPEQALEAQMLMGDSVDNVPGVAGIGPKTAAKLLQKYGSVQGVIEHADELSPKQRENVLAFAKQADVARRLLTLRYDVPVELDLERCTACKLNWESLRPLFEGLGFRRLLDQLPKGSRDQGIEGSRDQGAENRKPTENRASDEEGGIDQSPKRQRGASVEERPTPIEVPKTEVRKPKSRQPAPSLFEPTPEDEPCDEAAANTAPAVAAAPAAKPAPGTGWVGGGEIRRLATTDLAVRLRAPEAGAYRVVNTEAELEALAKQLSQQPEFALDTETTNINPIDADLIGLALAWNAGQGSYVPVRSVYDGALPLDAVRAALAPVLANEAIRKIGHNVKYDLIILRAAGLSVAGPLFDTMIAAFVVDPTRTAYGLDALTATLLGHNKTPITDLIGKGRQQLRMDQVPLDRLAEYAGEDADYTWRLSRLLEPQLATLGVAELFHQTEMPLVGVLTEMEYHGIRIDAKFLNKLGGQMGQRIETLGHEICALAGMDFNPDSPRQCAEVLFDKLGLRVIRRTKTARSTDAETLEILARETGHRLPQALLEYRELQKLRGTYIDALPAARSKRTDRVHTSFSQTAAVTGRLSSSEPNLQNIPVRTELGREIRRAFVPRTAGEVLIVADYSQVELRVLAHFSGDEALMEAFAADRDIHAFVAAQVNGVPLDQVTKDMRARAKAVNFGIIYGQTAFGLSRTTGMGRAEAQQFIEGYFRRYPRIREFLNKCIADATRDGFVRTILGRRRPIDGITSRNQSVRSLAERLAINSVIQGSAADLIKTAMIKLQGWIEAERLPLRMLLQVHDELVFEAPRAEAPRLAGRIADIMSHAIELRVPVKVDVAWGENWLEAK
jgi:DNA polymerase I